MCLSIMLAILRVMAISNNAWCPLTIAAVAVGAAGLGILVKSHRT